MKTADGADFHLGMDLYLPGTDGAIEDFRKIETSPETHDIDSFEYQGRTVHCIGRKGFVGKKGLGASTDLLHFYSSPAAIIQQKIDELKRQIQPTLDEIARLEILKGK